MNEDFRQLCLVKWILQNVLTCLHETRGERRCQINLIVLLLTNSWSGSFRSSHWRCSVRKVVLRNFAEFTGKHRRQSLFFNKVADLRPATLFKKRLWHRCFPVNSTKFLWTPFLQNSSGRLLLFVYTKLRKRNLLVIPSCVVWKISETFPKEDGLSTHC